MAEDASGAGIGREPLCGRSGGRAGWEPLALVGGRAANTCWTHARGCTWLCGVIAVLHHQLRSDPPRPSGLRAGAYHAGVPGSAQHERAHHGLPIVHAVGGRALQSAAGDCRTLHARLPRS